MSARENLLLGRTGATDADVEEALEVAQAGFVHDLPWGLDTRIGEQGMSLSGGQRQRLALARAVLAQPRILVLDDTLSALDVHTEKLVETALRRVLRDATGIVVAHRASTVLLADKVALLQGGTITHVGQHSDLLATVPAYRDLLAADADEELRASSELSVRDASRQATTHGPGRAGVARCRRRAQRRRAHRAQLGDAAGALAPAADRPDPPAQAGAVGAARRRPRGERRAAVDPLPRQGGHRPRHPADPGVR